VTDSEGNDRWRNLEDIKDDDTICINPKEDAPYYMSNTPGRKPKEPVSPKAAKKKKHINQDPLVIISRDNPESPEVINQVIEGLAQEAAHIDAARSDLKLEGRDAINAATKRSQALRAVGETWLRRKEQIQKKDIDLKSPQFTVLFEFIMETVRESMLATGLREEAVETAFAKLSHKLDEVWEAEARNRMKSV
jgi:hypothetical protein